ncbi:MAG TPA: protein kinase [Kofleriaceae bacterium]|nr:protein kinase [Kofleriaceae bacterium]
MISHLATGGMAQIYLARQTGLGSFERHVVLKTILRERAADQRFVTMFLDEAKLAATLNHQNVAQVYEVDHADGAYFMAMEYVHGENTRAILETTIRRGWTIPLELGIMIINGAAAGLHHAHERRGKNGQPLQIVHRDVSPANIMVAYDGAIKVLDFGIAKAEERATKTIGGTIKGKYGYMSPEQCKGRPIDRRSDIFALGIVLYELSTLRRAFKGNDDFETMKRIVAGDLVLPSTLIPGFPRELEAIILTALASDPGARFQSAQELIEALDAFTVRAKLTGSNTAMSRFMGQLFGTKKEPWIDTGLQSTDHTLVTPAEISEPFDDDNDETLVLGNRQDIQNVLEQLNLTPYGAGSAPVSSAANPGSAPAVARTPSPMIAGPPPEPTPRPQAGPPPGPPPGPERARRPSVRRTGERPALPFSGASPSSTERSTVPMPHPAERKTAPMPGSSGERRPSDPNLAMTVIGPVPITPDEPPPVASLIGIPSGSLSGSMPAMSPVLPMPMPPVTMPPATMPPTAVPPMPPTSALGPLGHPGPPGHPGHPGQSGQSGMMPPMSAGASVPGMPMPSASMSNRALAPSGLPSLVNDELSSHTGSRSLVTDPKLGWSTSVKLTAPNDGSHTRLQSGQVNVKLQSNTRWVVLSFALVLVVAALVVLILET